MTKWIPALVAGAACLLPTSAPAQSRTAEVYVSVLDSSGAPVTDLTAQDFRVREDGIAREVVKVAPATARLSVALLVDDSQAAGPSLQMIREGLHDFIAALAGKAEVAIITFGERPTVVINYTTDQKRLLDAAARIFPRSGSGAYFMDAIVDASNGFAKRKAERPVIAALLLEDPHEFSNRSYTQVLDALQQGGAALHLIAVGGPAAATTDELRNRNEAIALGTERTGGRRDQVLAETAIPARMRQLADELTHQYVVTYASPEELIPSEKLEVTVTRPGLTARARTRVAAR
jgi:Ca-activated chloride channel family protein